MASDEKTDGPCAAASGVGDLIESHRICTLHKRDIKKAFDFALQR